MAELTSVEFKELFKCALQEQDLRVMRTLLATDEHIYEAHELVFSEGLCEGARFLFSLGYYPPPDTIHTLDRKSVV